MSAQPLLQVDVDLSEMQTLAEQCAAVLRELQLTGLWVCLEGDLGAGKTTFMQLLLKALGYPGRVKSPTYPLVESYTLPMADVHHMDWYRLESQQELEALGFKEWVAQSWVFVEWSSRFSELSKQADLTIRLQGHDTRRMLQFEAHSPVGKSIQDGVIRLRSRC